MASSDKSTQDIDTEETDPKTEASSTVPEEGAPVVIEEPAPEDDATAEAVLDDQAEEETSSDLIPPTETVVERTVVEKRGGFFPTVLGGVVAAGLGFGAAQYVNNGWPFAASEGQDTFAIETRQTLDAQEKALAELRSDLSGRASASEVAELNKAVQGVGGDLRGDVDALRADLAGVSERLVTLEKRPMAAGLSQEAIAAYEGELQKLQDAVSAQRAEIEDMAARALASTEAAAETERMAAARGALTRIVAALDAGESYEAPLAALEGAGLTAPSALARPAAQGVATLNALQDAFPPAARAALAEARRAPDAAQGGFGNFLKAQLGARSVAPREGSDPDAVLSRAEDAMRRGRLSDALAEIASLPEVAQAPLSAWRAQAEERRDALAAADTLAQELSQK